MLLILEIILLCISIIGIVASIFISSKLYWVIFANNKTHHISTNTEKIYPASTHNTHPHHMYSSRSQSSSQRNRKKPRQRPRPLSLSLRPRKNKRKGDIEAQPHLHLHRADSENYNSFSPSAPTSTSTSSSSTLLYNEDANGTGRIASATGTDSNLSTPSLSTRARRFGGRRGNDEDGDGRESGFEIDLGNYFSPNGVGIRRCEFDEDERWKWLG